MVNYFSFVRTIMISRRKDGIPKGQIFFVNLLNDQDVVILKIEGFTVIKLLTSVDQNRNLMIPEYVTLFLIKKRLVYEFSCSADALCRKLFNLDINNWLLGKEVQRIHRCKLLLRGLGCKASLIDFRRKIKLKVGYSHFVRLTIPKTVVVRISKSVITIEGCNFSKVGDFAQKIYRVRTPDAYKGKGIWYRNKVQNLKALRKK